MNPDPTQASQAPEAELPQAPPGVEEGHDASTPGEPGAAEAELATEPAEAFAMAGEELEALAAKAAKADEYLQLAQRTQADFENFRKRAARDAAIAKERGATKLALELLPAVDNLERALEHAPVESDPTHPDNGAFVSGIRHVHSDLVAALQRAGIERYSPEGEQFDPTLHEAVAQQPVEGYEPGTVVEVFQRGYRIGDSVVRPARVVVAG
ncbi:MAG TPA: nucleotide exchange factor GrpE [Solirubrobacteraceae bacterium]|jgi:molecular chaperone GrpE|nr:nucleotide exchange factor GrpE [Solirubrobacteraceae bacterium]